MKDDFRLIGTRFPRHRFVALEGERFVEPDKLAMVLTGFHPAYIIRNFVAREVCGALSQAYRSRQAKRREDGVPAHEIGVGAYGISPGEYYHKVSETTADIEELFAAAGVHLPTLVDTSLQAAADPGLVVRPALSGGRAAARFRAIHFCDTGELALKPHEDRSQIGSSSADFEPAGVQVVLGGNVYADTPAHEGGSLRMWNICPSRATKALLGVERTGYPYAEELLATTEYLDVKPRTGDLFLFSADLVHAVTSWSGTAEERIVFQSFLGLSGSSILRWT